MGILKTCSKCKCELELSEFSKSKAAIDKLQHKCKGCVKVYREVNTSKFTGYQKVYREGNKDKIAKGQKVYYEANKDKIAEYHRMHWEVNKLNIIMVRKLWSKANTARLNALAAKRRASKLNATPVWLTVDDLAQIEALYITAQNLSVSTGIKHHVDHIVPLQGKTVCGLHVPWNLQVLTAAENSSKSNKLQT